MNTMTKSISITRLTKHRAAACSNKAGLFALVAARIYIGKIGVGVLNVVAPLDKLQNKFNIFNFNYLNKFSPC